MRSAFPACRSSNRIYRSLDSSISRIWAHDRTWFAWSAGLKLPKAVGRPPWIGTACYHHARHQGPTIYALSSAPGRAAIAVIRISGPASLDIYRSLCPNTRTPETRVAVVRTLYAPNEAPTRDAVLDPRALILYFQSPRTVTGEDVLELHVHGGPAIVKAVLNGISRCGDMQSLRYAEPGEFTQRAFMNNRMDLTQVEALGDTLAADTEQQRRLSVRGATSSLAKQYEKWRRQLLYARGELEALIDFSEDQHFDESPAELCASVAEQVHVLKRGLHIHSQNAVRGELLRHGISISLLGSPNTGKSSLLNRIVGREAAIVSNEAGTTRDVVEVGLDLGGYFCRFGDTAGLRQAMADGTAKGMENPDAAISRIEEEGMRRARERASDSDIVVVLFSFEKLLSNHAATLKLDSEVCAVADRLINDKDNVILVVNKTDLAADPQAVHQACKVVRQRFPRVRAGNVHMVSCMESSRMTALKEPTQLYCSSSSSSSSSSSPTPPNMQSSNNTGGIQSFLHGLIREFEGLTAALTPHGTGNDEHADPSAGADLSIWQESLGASERHRGLLDTCIRHLDAFLAEVNRPVPLLRDVVGMSPRHVDADGAPQRAIEDDDEEEEEEGGEVDIVVAAEHLRFAAECLAKITGRGESGDVEEVLGVVFEKFCVGK